MHNKVRRKLMFVNFISLNLVHYSLTVTLYTLLTIFVYRIESSMFQTMSQNIHTHLMKKLCY